MLRIPSLFVFRYVCYTLCISQHPADYYPFLPASFLGDVTMGKARILPASVVFTLYMIFMISMVVSGAVYDSQTAELEGKLLFPGDSIHSDVQVRVAPDLTYADMSEGVWTNTDPERAYQVNYFTDEECGTYLLVTPAGYVISVEGGVTSSDDGLGDTHIAGSSDSFSRDPSEQVPEDIEGASDTFSRDPSEQFPKDIACYPEGTMVRLSAAVFEDGLIFGHWEFEPQIYLENIGSPELTFQMPGFAVSVKAVYSSANEMEAASGVSEMEEVSYQPETDEYYFSAEAESSRWNGSRKWNAEQGEYPDDWDEPEMKEEDIPKKLEDMISSDEISADDPDQAKSISAGSNRIEGLSDGAEYQKDERLSFTAVGSGPDSQNPEPGVTKWVPSTYQIGNVSGGWSGSNYSTSITFSTPGEYTLGVTFIEQIFDGNIWINTNKADQKSVTFKVVSVPAAQTGDHTPLAALSATAAAALTLAFVIFRRRKNTRRAG